MTYSSDIVRELGDWLGRLSADARCGKRNIQPPDFEIELLRRTIAEINILQEKLGERRGTRSIATEDLNASNDE